MTVTTNAMDTLVSQYKESPTLISFFNALLSELEALEIAYNDVQTLRYLSTATGAQLDVIGVLLGINRTIVDGIVALFFGFDPEATALSFGDLNDPAIGGRYRSADEGEGSIRFLTDEEFRIYITGRISTNVSRCTGNDIIRATQFFFNVLDGTTPIVSVQDRDMEFFVFIERILSPTEDALLRQLNLIPKAIGVRMAIINYDINNVPAWAIGTIYAYGNFVKASNAQNYVSIEDNNLGNDPITSPTQWALSSVQ